MGKWSILEAFNTRYKTTGITYKGENETKATTQLGSLVDLNFLPIIGLGGEIDWGVQPYDTGANGGIVGTVTYDTTRNELDPADAATEPYQPGIPDVPVNLFVPKPCTAAAADQANECRQGYEIVPLQIPDPTDSTKTINNPAADRGAFVKGPQVQDTYTSEKWDAAAWLHGAPVQRRAADRPAGAVAGLRYQHDSGDIEPVRRGADDGRGCRPERQHTRCRLADRERQLWLRDLEDQPLCARKREEPGAEPRSALYADLAANGYDEQDLPAIDYIVSVDIPKDPVDGKPMYKVTSEAESTSSTATPTCRSRTTRRPPRPRPPTHAGPPHALTRPQPSQPPSQQAGIISPCVGTLHTVRVS